MHVHVVRGAGEQGAWTQFFLPSAAGDHCAPRLLGTVKGQNKNWNDMPSTPSIIRSSWAVPNRTQGKMLRVGQAHPDVLQRLACISMETPNGNTSVLCPFHLYRPRQGRGGDVASLTELAARLPAPSPSW